MTDEISMRCKTLSGGNKNINSTYCMKNSTAFGFSAFLSAKTLHVWVISDLSFCVRPVVGSGEVSVCAAGAKKLSK